MSVLFRSASKQRAWLTELLYEVALFTAWHGAAFTQAVEVGKLHDFAYYRAQLNKRVAAPAPAPTWQQQKAARKRQMDLLEKHRRRRQAPVKPRR